MDNTLIRSGIAAGCTPTDAVNGQSTLYHWARLALAPVLSALIFAGGCTGSRHYTVTVEGDIPKPNIESVPFTVGVYYDPKFADFTTEQESLQGDQWQVAFGDMQRRYFHTMLVHTFSEVVETESADPSEMAPQIEFLIVPRVENFSFLTPKEAGSKFFAVSMRHHVEFLGRDGTAYGTWEINSYGRSRNSFGASTTGLAAEACQDALRDMATSVVVGMPEQLVSRGIVDPDDNLSVGE